jgi:hypothetical protein
MVAVNSYITQLIESCNASEIYKLSDSGLKLHLQLVPSNIYIFAVQVVLALNRLSMLQAHLWLLKYVKGEIVRRM